MIISNIIGGLGNQMFQYASALALTKQLSTELKIDIRDFDNYKLHQGFELNNVFNCNIEFATNAELDRVLGLSKYKLIKRILRRQIMCWARNKKHVVEPSFHFWPGFHQLTSDIYLDGYWQSEKYFSESESDVRKAFTFRHPLSNKNLEIADSISKVNAVSLHVRRGDYVTNSKNAFLGTCSLDYYQQAIDHISAHVKNPVFFIFSDDIRWVKDHLTLNYEKNYIDHNTGKKSHFDMHLMSLCKHHIIANSSFSWWGAWLNPNKEKIVIAPKNWFSNDLNDRDLIPSSWVRV